MIKKHAKNNRDLPRVIHVTTIGITAYRALLAQCSYYRQSGLEVGFVFSPSPEGTILRRLGFPVQEIYIPRIINPWSDARAIIQLRDYFREARPNIVHTHTSKAGVAGRVAAKLAGVPHVFHTVHGFPFHAGMFWGKRLIYQQIEKWLARHTDVMLSQSAEDVVTAAELGIKPGMGGLVHIGNGVDLEEFNPAQYSSRQLLEIRARLGISEAMPVVAMIGRINREKGYHDLVEALQQVRDIPWHALFIGPDEGFLDELMKQIDNYGLRERIHILGMRSDITDLLAVSDIYVLPSYREGLPRSLIEAQAMALACVATDIRGCREVVEKDVTGFLFQAGDHITLGGLLRRLLLAPELRQRMGQAGRRRVYGYFNEYEVAKKIMSLYEETLNLNKVCVDIN